MPLQVHIGSMFLGIIISRNGVKPDPQKLKAMTEIPPPKISERATNIFWNDKLSYQVLS